MPRARFLGFLTIFCCRSVSGAPSIALEHAQVAADDGGGGAQLVNGQREELRIVLARVRVVSATCVARRSMPERLGRTRERSTGSSATAPSAAARTAPYNQGQVP